MYSQTNINAFFTYCLVDTNQNVFFLSYFSNLGVSICIMERTISTGSFSISCCTPDMTGQDRIVIWRHVLPRSVLAKTVQSRNIVILEGMAPYGCLLLAPAEDWWPSATWRALQALLIAVLAETTYVFTGTNSGTYCDTPYSLQPSGYLDLQHGSNVKKNVTEEERRGRTSSGLGFWLSKLTV